MTLDWNAHLFVFVIEADKLVNEEEQIETENDHPTVD